MTIPPTLSTRQGKALLDVIRDSLAIRRHQDLLHWLHDEVQNLVPHDILIAAWGDFSLGLIHLDIISYLPGLRTAEIDNDALLPPMMHLFQRWLDSGRSPYALSLMSDGEFRFIPGVGDGFDRGIDLMQSAMVQGIKDERGRHDCLYVALSAHATFKPGEVHAMALLLPYIDTALRQVAHLPMQYPATTGDLDAEDASPEDLPANSVTFGLSSREFEIMRWVCEGKTN